MGENPCRLGNLLLWALNTLILQKQKWVWVSDRDPKPSPVHWIHSQGCFRTGIREGAEGISCFWILPMLPCSYRAALGLPGCSDGGLWGVKITGVSDCVVYPYIIKLYTEQEATGTEVMWVVQIIFPWRPNIKYKFSKTGEEKCIHFPLNEVKMHCAQGVWIPRQIQTEKGMRSQLPFSAVLLLFQTVSPALGTILVTRYADFIPSFCTSHKHKM